MADSIYEMGLSLLKSAKKAKTALTKNNAATTTAVSDAFEESNILTITKDLNKAGSAASSAVAANLSVTPPISLTDGMNISLASSVAELSKASSSLAIPTFSSGPNDTFAAADIYSLADTGKTINNILATDVSKPVAALKGSKASESSLTDKLINASKKIKVKDLSNPTAMLDKTFPTLFPSINRVSKNCDGAGNSLIRGINRDLLNSRKYGTNGGGRYRIKNKDLNCSLAMGDIINSLAKSNGCTTTPFGTDDRKTKAAALSNVGKIAAGLGMGGIFSSLICGLNDIFTVSKVAKDLAKSISKFSDLKSLKAMALSTAKGLLKKSGPTIIKDFAKNFSKSAPGVTMTGKDSYVDMMSGFNTIDSNWLSTDTVGNGKVGDLSNAIGASSDFTNVVGEGISLDSILTPAPTSSVFTNSIVALSTDSVPNQDLLFAKSFSEPVTVEKSIFSNFPKTILEVGDRLSGLNKTLSDPVSLFKGQAKTTNNAKENIIVHNGSLVSVPKTTTVVTPTDAFVQAKLEYDTAKVTTHTDTYSNIKPDMTRDWVRTSDQTYKHYDSPYYNNGVIISTQTVEKRILSDGSLITHHYDYD